ncbi:hypothetical protein DFH09DRAFT_1488629 [Mycena vulgaris]|nr:hypothetical protein DFH09DRAFT_1488629 [Mycena vulgaris]
MAHSFQLSLDPVKYAGAATNVDENMRLGLLSFQPPQSGIQFEWCGPANLPNLRAPLQPGKSLSLGHAYEVTSFDGAHQGYQYYFGNGTSIPPMCTNVDPSAQSTCTPSYGRRELRGSIFPGNRVRLLSPVCSETQPRQPSDPTVDSRYAGSALNLTATWARPSRSEMSDAEDWEDYKAGGWPSRSAIPSLITATRSSASSAGTTFASSSLHGTAGAVYDFLESSTRYTGETVLAEIKLLQHLIASSTPNGATNFRHTEPMCSVFEVPGENLLELIKHRVRCVPLELCASRIPATQNKGVGLDYMHRCRGVIHTNIKPQ